MEFPPNGQFLYSYYWVIKQPVAYLAEKSAPLEKGPLLPGDSLLKSHLANKAPGRLPAKYMRCLLLLSVVLLATACKKEPTPDPAPAAALEGHWVWQHATDTHYDASGHLIATQAQKGAPGDYLLVVTGQTFQYFRGNGAVDTPPLGYTRQNDTLVVNVLTRLTLKELTQRTLVLYHRGDYTSPTAGNSGGRLDTDVYYSR